MSAITLVDLKAGMRVIHSSDDGILQKHLDASESELLRFLNLETLPVVDPEAEPAVVVPEIFPAVCLLVQTKYEVADPAEIERIRAAAETLVMPYRATMGV